MSKVKGNVVLKSGIWYTISNFLFRSIAFITAPIFSRVLSKDDYGQYNNIASWVAVMSILFACDIHSSIIRAKLDYEEDLPSYSFSALVLSNIITISFYIVFLIFGNQISAFTGIDKKYFHIIFLFILFQEAFYNFITTERAFYRYKAFSLLTGLIVVSTSLLSVFLVVLCNNKLDGRVYGQYIPYVVIGLFMYILIVKRGKTIKKSYLKYALFFSLPLVPHQLSLIVLGSSDRIMLTKMAGTEHTAIYSVAYIITVIIYALLDSMNKAWAPWVLDNLKQGNKRLIKKYSTKYFGLFFVMIVGILLVAPEVMLFLGGKKYIEGVGVLPPLIIGCLFQFAYTMFVQVEFFEKKMKVVAMGTTVAAIVNIVLNYIFIGKYGYIAAGYTTLAGYVVLFLIHYNTICKLGYKKLFDLKTILTCLAISFPMILIFELIYKNNIIRYILFVIYMILFVYILFINKKRIKKLLRG
ncbi:oligosaccharide flippase family protein [Parvimonas micra]|uniref:oligosaccharide flippase family protein n=1 Tax=Parvimonas micra TaxID=33033 RepID=UPI0030D37285